MAQVIQPPLTDESQQDSWSFQMTLSNNDIDARIEEVRAAAAALADLPATATNAEIAARLNIITALIAQL